MATTGLGPTGIFDEEGFEGRPVEATGDIVASERGAALGEPEELFDFGPSGVLDPIGGSFTPPAPTPERRPLLAEALPDEAPEPLAQGYDFGPSGIFDDQPAPSPGAGMFRLPMPGSVAGEAGYADPSQMLEHPEIPGLTFEGARVKEVPDYLTEEVPEAFKRSHGRLSDDELQSLWYQTAARYNKIFDVNERVRILGDFISEWKPEVAETYGYTKGGHVDPEGFWGALDAIDKYVDRPLRALVNTMWDMRKADAAADLSDRVESPGLDDAWRMLQRNFDDDIGADPDGERVLKSMFLFAQNALTGFDDERALLSEDSYQESMSGVADAMTWGGYTAAAPVLKLLTGASDEDIERSIQESIEEGSKGAHFTMGLAGLMLVSPLNFLGGAGIIEKGLSQAATQLLRGGVKLTPRGAAIAGNMGEEALSQGRRLLVSELAAEYGEEAVSSLSTLSRRIDRAEEAVSSRRQRAASIGYGEEAAGKDPLRGIQVGEDALGSQVEKLTTLKDDLLAQFDEQLDKIRGREFSYEKVGPGGKVEEAVLPASALREDAAFRASAVAAANTTEAVSQAFKFNVALRGAFAVNLLSQLQTFALAKKIDLGVVNNMWARGLEAADKADGILLKVLPERPLASGDKVGAVPFKSVIKDPEVAYIYERAAAGDYGVSARIASLRPEYDALETLLSKGVKGVPKLDELKRVAAKELAEAQKAGRHFAPVRDAAGRAIDVAVERVRGGKAGVKRLKDPKRVLLQGENLASNVNPAMFSIAHSIAKKIPWLDKARQAAAGVGRLTRYPATYTRKNPHTGKLEAIPRAQLDHPALFYKGQKAQRQMLRARNVIQARYPAIREQLLRISDDPEIHELMAGAVEAGWADPESALKNMDEIIAVAAIRKIREVNDSILESITDVDVGGKTAAVISRADTERAVNALEKLRSMEALEGRTFPGYDSDIIKEIAEQVAFYGAESEHLTALRAQLPDYAKGSDNLKERGMKLSFIKKRLQVFSAFYEASLRSAIKTRTELKIAEVADARAPEIKNLQEKILSMEDRLKEIKSDALEPREYMDFIEDAIEVAAEELPELNMDRVVQLSMKDLRPGWASIAEKIEMPALQEHMAGVYRGLQRVYGDDADVLMNHLQVQADLAVRQGVVKRPEEWFYQMDLAVGGKAPKPMAGMLFQEGKAAPIFYSRLQYVISNTYGVNKAKSYSAAGIVDSLLKAGLSPKIVDELDIDGWVFGQEKDLGRRDASLDEVYQLNDEGRLTKGADEAALAENVPSLYKRFLDEDLSRTPPEHRARRRDALPASFRVKRGDLESFLNERGVDADTILSRLDQRADDLGVAELLRVVEKDISKMDPKVKLQEIKATGFGRYLERLMREGEAAGLKAGDIRVNRGKLEDFLEDNAVELVDDFRGHYAYLNDKRAAAPHRMPREDASAVVDDWKEVVEDRVADLWEEPVELVDARVLGDEDGFFIEVEARFPGAPYPEVEQFPARALGFGDRDLLRVESAQGRLDDLDVLAKGDEGLDDVELQEFNEARQRSASENKWAMDDNYLFLVSPGGEKNFELLVLNPGSGVVGQSSQSHWPGMRGIAGHMRANIRTDEKGRRVLYIEELQADNAQDLAGARRTVKETGDLLKRIDETFGDSELPEFSQYTKKVGSLLFPNRREYRAAVKQGAKAGKDEAAVVYERLNKKRRELREAKSAVKRLPDSHSDGWKDLGLKRALHFAVVDADEAIDAIAWTTGKTQQVRYGLDKVVFGKEQGKGLVKQYDEDLQNISSKLFGVGGERFSFNVTKSFDDAADRATRFEGDIKTVTDPETGATKDIDLYKGTLEKINKTAPKKGGKRTLEANGFVITDELRDKIKSDAQELFQQQESQRLGMMKVIENDRVLIQAFEGSNKSTIVHELGHLLRRNLAKADQLVVKDWLVDESERLRGLKPEELPADLKHLFPDGKVGRVVDDEGNFTAFGEELFTRGFENYLATGRAPKGAPEKLKEAFAKLAEWVKAAYDNVLGRNDVRVNSDVKEILDRYFMGKERPVKKKELWETPFADVPPEMADQWRAAVKAAIKDPNVRVPIENLSEFSDEFLESVSAHVGSARAKAAKSVTALKAAQRALTKAKKALSDAETDLQRATAQKTIDLANGKLLSAVAKSTAANKAAKLSAAEIKRLQAGIRRVKKAGEKEGYVIPEGSRERRTLQAVQQLYKDRMAGVIGELQQEAFLLRQQAEAQEKAVMLGLAPKRFMGKAGREKLEVLARLLGDSDLSADIPNISQSVVNDLIKKMNDPKITQEYNRLRAKILKLPEDQRAAAEAVGMNKIYQRMSDIQVKAEAGKKMTPLQEAVALVGSQEVVKGLPGQRLSKAELRAAMGDMNNQMDELIEALKEVDYDLRPVDDVRREFESAVNSSLNRLEGARAEWDARLKAFEDDQAAHVLKDMTEAQRAKVYKIINNPDLHDIVAGKRVSITTLTERLASVTAKIESTEAAGKDVPDHMLRTKDKIQKQLDILGDDEEFEKVLQGARFIKRFFDDWLKELRSKGILDDTLSEEVFYQRVSVGSYMPHMVTWAAQNKIRGLVGKGLLPSTFTPGFAKMRKIEGTIAEINAAKRFELAAEVVRHQARGGAFGAEAQAAADQSLSALGKAIDDIKAENPAALGWDEMVENARIEFGLDDMYDFFETDPLALMERYHSAASKKMSDAMFIEDILDLFPRGRQFEELYGPNADHQARLAGYVRLSKVDQLQSLLRAKMPEKLRAFEPLIKQRLNEGVPLNEVLDHLKANGIDVEPEIVAAFKTKDVFVPTQIAEYLNWMSGKDALWAKESLPLNIWDGIHSWMKGQATIVALAHIGRNFIGNTVSAVQELGWRAVNPTVQFKAMRIWGSWGDESLDSLVKIGSHEYTVREWRKIFQESGFYDAPLSGDFMRESVGLPGLKEATTGKDLLIQTGLAAGGAIVGGATGAMFGLVPAAAFGGAALGLVAGRSWTGAKTVKGGTWFEKAVGMTAEEMDKVPRQAIAAGGARASGALAGGIIGSAAGPLGAAFGAALLGKSMPDYMRMMGTLNQSIESQARLSMAVAALEQGKSIDDALASVNKALRDYSDLSPLEKNVMRRMFFFYTWEAGNFKFQLDWMRKNPRGAKMVHSFFNGLYKYQFEEEDMAAIPEQWRYRVVLKTGLGKVMSISGLPMEPMMDILTRGKKVQNPKGLATRVHPIPLTMFEWFFGGGRSVYYNKGWEELNNVRQLKNAPPGFKDIVGFPEEGEETWVPVYKNGVLVGSRADYRADNAKLFYLMQKFPGYRVLAQYMVMATDTFNSYAMDTAAGPEESDELRAKWWERMLMFTLGYKVSNIDWEQQKSYAAWRLEQDLLKELEIRKRKARRKISKLNVATGWTMPRQDIEGGVEGPFSE